MTTSVWVYRDTAPQRHLYNPADITVIGLGFNGIVRRRDSDPVIGARWPKAAALPGQGRVVIRERITPITPDQELVRAEAFSNGVWIEQSGITSQGCYV